jgi:hypothetical protein
MLMLSSSAIVSLKAAMVDGYFFLQSLAHHVVAEANGVKEGEFLNTAT